MVVKVCHVLGQHRLEVAAVEDQHQVESLAAEGADPSLGDRVRSRCPYRCAQDADTFVGEHGVGEHGIEDASELAVAIPGQEREARHTVAEVPQVGFSEASRSTCGVL